MPSRFHFRLQPVLDQRERTEDHHQRIVADLDRQRLAIETKLRDTQLQIQQTKLDLRSHLTSPSLAIADVRAQAGMSLHLEARARHTALELAGAYRRLEHARAELLRAATARRAVELLKERRLAEHKHEQNRLESAATDEAATHMFLRQTSQLQSALGAHPTD